MGSALDRCFRPFEGTRNAYPVALFRIAFFSGPRHALFPHAAVAGRGIPSGGAAQRAVERVALRALLAGAARRAARRSIVTMLACMTAILGLYPRASAIVSGDRVLRLRELQLDVRADARPHPDLGDPAPLDDLRRGRGRGSRCASAKGSNRAWASRWSRGCCPGSSCSRCCSASSSRGSRRSSPGGHGATRWASSCPTPRVSWSATGSRRRPSCTVRSSGTRCRGSRVVVELGTPIGLLFRRTRVVSLVLYELFFLGIITMLEVPALFYCIFAFGGLLALDDEQVTSSAVLPRTPPEKLRARPS